MENGKLTVHLGQNLERPSMQANPEPGLAPNTPIRRLGLSKKGLLIGYITAILSFATEKKTPAPPMV